MKTRSDLLSLGLKQWKTSFAPLRSQEVCLLLQSGWCCRKDQLKLLGEVGKRSRAGTCGSGASSFWKEKQNRTLYQLYQQGWSQSKGDLAGSKHRYGYGSPPCQNLQQQPVFLHYCSENVIPLCSALQMTGSTSRRMTALPGDLPITVYAGVFYFRFGNTRPEWFLILMSLSNGHSAAVTLTCGKSRRNESFHSIHSIMKNSQTFLKFCT
ncbi:uncharacterized protein LOC115348602 [Aquila chrysaetos chrysaetos]|uniref:uncharacterized protein LOC115348602 n=1 Tax=Aquila chrysaetos chrysaetos TaxID=223781 RepID=UPI0011770734|nr:uncharacterized protein LOC115348602 [Aquila chrysaetos chrysaetos]